MTKVIFVKWKVFILWYNKVFYAGVKKMNHLQSNPPNKLPEKTNLTTERRKKEKTNDVIVVSLLKEVLHLNRTIFLSQLNLAFWINVRFGISITVVKHARHKEKDKERESDRRKRQWEEDKARRDWERQKRRDQARAHSRRERSGFILSIATRHERGFITFHIICVP